MGEASEATGGAANVADLRFISGEELREPASESSSSSELPRFCLLLAAWYTERRLPPLIVTSAFSTAASKCSLSASKLRGGHAEVTRRSRGGHAEVKREGRARGWCRRTRRRRLPSCADGVDTHVLKISRSSFRVIESSEQRERAVTVYSTGVTCSKTSCTYHGR